MEFNLEKEIKCVCGNIYENNDFRHHYKECAQFKEVFNDFDKKISKYIKSHSNPKEQLLLIKFIFERYVNILDRKIRGNFVEITQAFKESFLKSLEMNKKENENNSIKDIDNNNADISYYEKMFFLEDKKEK